MTRFPEGNYHVPELAWVRDLRRHRGLPAQGVLRPVRAADRVAHDGRLVRLHRLPDLSGAEAHCARYGSPGPGDDRGPAGGVIGAASAATFRQRAVIPSAARDLLPGRSIPAE